MNYKKKLIKISLPPAREKSIRHGHPTKLHISQFTSNDFTEILEKERIRISMDGKGRLMTISSWNGGSVKYEEVYLHQYLTVSEARRGLDKYFMFYNTERIHESLGYKTRYEMYFTEPIKTDGLTMHQIQPHFLS
jgi:putative transposase